MFAPGWMQYFNSVFPQTEPRYCEFGLIIYHLGLTFHSWTAFSWKEAAVQGVKGFLLSLILVWKEFQIIRKGHICKYFSYLKATGVLRIHRKDSCKLTVFSEAVLYMKLKSFYLLWTKQKYFCTGFASPGGLQLFTVASLMSLPSTLFPSAAGHSCLQTEPLGAQYYSHKSYLPAGEPSRATGSRRARCSSRERKPTWKS